MFLQYKYATCLDVFFVLLGTIGSAASGACMPLMMMYFGDVTGAIVQYSNNIASYPEATNRSSPNITHIGDQLTAAVTKFCIQTCVLGLVSFICIYVSVVVFSFAAVRQVRNKLVFKAHTYLHKQECCLFLD